MYRNRAPRGNSPSQIAKIATDGECAATLQKMNSRLGFADLKVENRNLADDLLVKKVITAHMPKTFSQSARYAFAIGSVAAATLVRMLLTPVLGTEFPFFTYFVAVLFTSSVAGFAPGILTIFLGLIAADLFFYVNTAMEADPVSVVVYVATTLVVVFATQAKHKYNTLIAQNVAEANVHEQALEKEVVFRVKAEEAARVNDASFRVLFGLSAIGHAKIDPVSGLFLQVNERLCEILGYSEEELLAMTIRQVAVPADNEWDTRTFRRMMEGQSAESAMERRYVCKGGRTIWCNVASSILRDSENRPVCTLLAIQDVTARRKAEEGLNAAQLKIKNYSVDLEKNVADRTVELKEMVQELEGFCYNVAHDLRTPIRAIRSYAETLVTRCALDDRSKEYAQHICQSTAHMEQMSHDLLTYGRMVHEPMPKEPLHLGAMLDHVLAQLAVEIDTTKALINVEHPLPEVLGHPAVLEQVLLQLLRNALTYVRPGVQPQVTVRGEVRENVRVWVVDNGVGIDPQAHDKIFHIFKRLHETEGYSGSGIGLALVKKGIERMGGHVGVFSKPGEGSSFWFELNKVQGQHAHVSTEAVSKV